MHFLRSYLPAWKGSFGPLLLEILLSGDELLFRVQQRLDALQVAVQVVVERVQVALVLLVLLVA